MKPFALVALFIVGATANYGQSQPAIRTQSYGGSYNAPSSDMGYGSTSKGQAIPITRFNQEIRGSESSSVDFETGNGIRQSESTRVVQGRGGSYQNEYGQTVQSSGSLSKTGSVSYTSPEGQNIHLSWVADENGFRPTGDHLPTSPPIPAEIAASLNMGHSYGGSSYSAPASSPSYSAPAAPSYSAPAAPSYSAPAAPSYAAPAAPSYSAPAVRVAPVQVSYGSNVRSGGY